MSNDFKDLEDGLLELEKMNDERNKNCTHQPLCDECYNKMEKYISEVFDTCKQILIKEVTRTIKDKMKFQRFL
jgi:hypothetical protein